MTKRICVVLKARVKGLRKAPILEDKMEDPIVFERAVLANEVNLADADVLSPLSNKFTFLDYFKVTRYFILDQLTF